MATTIDGSVPPLRPQASPDPGPAPAPAAAAATVRPASAVNIDEILQLARSFAARPEATGARSGAARAGSTPTGAPELPAGGMSMDDAAVVLGFLMNKVNELQTQSQMGEIKSNQAEMEKKNAEQMEKVKKWLNDLSEAANAQKASGIWGWIKQIAMTVVAVVAAVIAVAASPFTGGASLIVAGLAVMAAMDSVFQLGVRIAVASGADVPKWVQNLSISFGQLAAFIASKCGASEETQMWLKLGVDLTVALATIAVTGGKSLYDISRKGKDMLQQIKALEMAPTTAKFVKYGSYAQGGAGVVGAVGAVGGTVSGVQAAQATERADLSLADKQEIAAHIMKLMATLEQNQDDLKKMAEAYQNVVTVISQLIRGEADMKSQISANLGGRGVAA